MFAKKKTNIFTFLAVKHLGFDDIHDFRQRGNVQFFSLCPKLTAIFQIALTVLFIFVSLKLARIGQN